MSLQKYVALLKTVELGSISLAAEQMGYTQSAVSRMILDLETVSYTHLTLPTTSRV